MLVRFRDQPPDGLAVTQQFERRVDVEEREGEVERAQRSGGQGALLGHERARHYHEKPAHQHQAAAEEAHDGEEGDPRLRLPEHLHRHLGDLRAALAGGCAVR